MDREEPTVAIDTSPLHGPRTGVGNAVAWTVDALAARDQPLLPYVTSTRARVEPPERRLPLPAAVAMRLWSRRASTPVRAMHQRWLGRPDVVHGTNYVVPPTTAPALVSVYDCWFLAHPERAHPDVRRAAAVLRRAVHEGAVVVTSSTASADRARALLGTRRVVPIPLGPPAPAMEPSAQDELADLAGTPFVVAIGSQEHRKNLPTLVRAFGRLAAEHATVRLVLAGAPSDDTAAVSAAIAALPDAVAERVTLAGVVGEGRKSWLLRNARALAYPSLDEGFGFPILEAQQVGTPVVASTAGSIPEVAGDAALLSPPGDVDALAANLHWVLTSDDKRRSLAACGSANVGRFSWDRTAAALVDLYRRLADSTP